MINIVKLFDYNSNRIIFINKLLKLQSNSYVIKLTGDVDKNKLFKFIKDIYKKHYIDCKLTCSDFMFSFNINEKCYLKVDKLYYCGQLSTNVILTTLEEDTCLEMRVNELYD